LPEPLLRIEGLKFSFGRTAVLRDVNLELRGRENCLLWGLNGSGKTTLGKLIAGLLRPDGGRVIMDSPAGKAPVGMVLAEPDRMLLGDTVYEDVLVGPENLNMGSEETAKRARTALEYVSLWEDRDRPTMELSTGERKRLAVAGALAMGAEILVLDEPFAFIDDVQAERLFAALNQITESGHSVLILSGNLRWPERYDKLFFLHDGIVEGGDPEDITKYISNQTTARLDAQMTGEDG
jgi:energy-coupling factor transporter ATP-binding protein EcfA2